MKKLFILAVAACFAGSAMQAQDVLKQTGGEKNIEVLFAPFGGSPVSISGIKFRSFTTATEAIRGEVFLGFGRTLDIDDVLDNGDEVTTTRSTFDVTVAGGIEFHLPGTDRLSPYYGGFLQLGLGRESRVSDEIGFNSDFEPIIDGESSRTDGFFSIGVFGVGGFDYYFAHNIYLGAEIGFGVNFTSMFDTQFESTQGNETTSSEMPNGNSFELGPGAVGRLRLGILF